MMDTPTVEQIAREAAEHIAIVFGMWKDKEALAKLITAALAPLQAELEQAKERSNKWFVELCDCQARLATAEAELQAYREGGLTEEILRRADGYIKVGRGCAIVLAKEKA